MMMLPIQQHVYAGIGTGRTGRARSAPPRSPAADAAGCVIPAISGRAAASLPLASFLPAHVACVPAPVMRRPGSACPLPGSPGQAPPYSRRGRGPGPSQRRALTFLLFFAVVSARRGAGCSSYSPPQSLRSPAGCGRIALPHPRPGSALAFCQTRKLSRGGRLCARSPLQVPFPGLFRPLLYT